MVVLTGLPSIVVNMNMPWQPPIPAKPARRWLPAAIIGAALVIAAGLVAGAFIIKDRNAGTTAGGSTCQSWKQTRLTLLAVPSLPANWSWTTPDIDNAVRLQNAPVGNALGLFEAEIVAEPSDVAQAARQYVTARRHQMQTLSDHTYTAPDGNAVDTALVQLDKLCGTGTTGSPA